MVTEIWEKLERRDRRVDLTKCIIYNIYGILKG